MLKLNRLKKTFGEDNTAVDHASVYLDQGEILCLLGPSGCGKTTLLRLIAGLEEPDKGTIVYNEQDVTQVPPHKRGFGMMFQDYALFPHKNVFANIAFGLEMRGDTPSSIEQRVQKMLTLVELEGFGSREIDHLSGGEQQRVALARALAPGPELLLLDEPLGALDRALRERLMIDLRTILKRVGVTAVYVTHDQTEALAIGDQVAVMNNGRIEQIAPPQDIFARPKSPFVARFLGFHNIVDGVVLETGQLKTAVGTFTLKDPTHHKADKMLTVLVKPDGVQFSRSPVGQAVLVDVRHIGFYGRYFQLTVEISSHNDVGRSIPFVFEVTTADYQQGDQIYMSVDPERLHIF